MNKRRMKKSVKIVLTAIITGIIATATTVTLLAINNSSVKVETFIGKTQEEVEVWANENDVDMSLIHYTYDYSDKYDEDIVIAQSLKEGESLNEDSSLTLTLSQGADPTVEFTLPDFTNQKEEVIKKYFDENKFLNVTYNYEYNTEVEVGTFISMNPEANTTVKRSETITVTISGEQVEVVVPDLASYSKSNIEAWAEANNIKINFEEEFSTDVEVGKIISISVNTNDVIHQGDTITVVISKGVEEETNESSETTKSSTGDNKSNRTVSNNYSAGSQGSTSSNNGTARGEGGTEIKPAQSCAVVYASLYNGWSASDIKSSLSASGCGVRISYANTPESNPDCIDGGIASVSSSDGVYYVTVYQAW